MTSTITRQQIVKIAQSWLSTPYVHQASTKDKGCDCLGLVRGIWRELIGDEPVATPHYSSDWGEVGGREILKSSVEKYFTKVEDKDRSIGDLVLFRWNADTIVKHLGVMTAPDRFIHAYEKAGVVESPLVRDWVTRIAGVYHFPGVK